MKMNANELCPIANNVSGKCLYQAFPNFFFDSSLPSLLQFSMRLPQVPFWETKLLAVINEKL
jgi:hypothetical protein